LKIPPDYGALDNVLFGSNGLGGPLINESRLAPKECYEFDERTGLTLPIPGDRLWRSTVVTLDGVRADRIEVLPDMRGILAVFNAPGSDSRTAQLSAGTDAAERGSDMLGRSMQVKKSRRLTVWTSEGSDWADVQFCETLPR